MRALEATLGLSLFRRDGRGVALTEPGARLAAVATDALDRIAEGAAALAEEAGAGLLRISVEPAFAARWLVPNLGGFRRHHPRVEIELDPTQRLADLKHDPVDLAIRYGRWPWAGTASDPLVRVFAFPVCSPDMVADGPPLAHPDDLRHFTLLHEETTRWWANWLALAGATLVDSTRGPRFRDTSLALEAAIAGQGVALGDTVLAAGDLASGRLIRPYAVEEPCESYHLVMAKAAA